MMELSNLGSSKRPSEQIYELAPPIGALVSRRFDGNFCENDDERATLQRYKVMRHALEQNQINVLTPMWTEAAGRQTVRKIKSKSSFAALLEAKANQDCPFNKDEVTGFMRSPTNRQIYEDARDRQSKGAILKKFSARLINFAQTSTSEVENVKIDIDFNDQNFQSPHAAAIQDFDSNTNNDGRTTPMVIQIQQKQYKYNSSHRLMENQDHIQQTTTSYQAGSNFSDHQNHHRNLMGQSYQKSYQQSFQARNSQHQHNVFATDQKNSRNNPFAQSVSMFGKEPVNQKNLMIFRNLQKRIPNTLQLRNNQKYYQKTANSLTGQLNVLEADALEIQQLGQSQQIEQGQFSKASNEPLTRNSKRTFQTDNWKHNVRRSVGYSDDVKPNPPFFSEQQDQSIRPQTNYMTNLSVAANQPSHLLLEQARGRNQITQNKRVIRDLNLALNKIVQGDKNQKNHEQEIQNFIQKIMDEKYPLDQDEWDIIERDLNKAIRNAQYRNDQRLKETCVRRKIEFDDFLENLKVSQAALAKKKRKQEAMDRRNVNNAMSMHKDIEEQFSKRKFFKLKVEDEDVSERPKSNLQFPRTPSRTSHLRSKSNILSDISPAHQPNLQVDNRHKNKTPQNIRSPSNMGTPRRLDAKTSQKQQTSADAQSKRSMSRSQSKQDMNKLNVLSGTTNSRKNHRDRSKGSSRKLVKNQGSRHNLNKDVDDDLLMPSKSGRGMGSASSGTISAFNVKNHNRSKQNNSKQIKRMRMYDNLKKCIQKCGGEGTFDQIVAAETGIKQMPSPEKALLNKKTGKFGAANGQDAQFMLYRDNSMEELIANDSLRHGPSRKHVIDEYFEMSRQSFKLLRKKIQV